MRIFGRPVYVLGEGPRPDPPGDLESYADARGLTWSREAALRPYSALFGPDDGDNLNTMRGLLPGGVRGVMGHRVTSFRSHGGESTTRRIVREAATYAGVLVPETKATLSALEVRACDSRVDEDDGVPLQGDRSAHGWHLAAGRLADEQLVQAIWDGEVGQWVRASYPDGRLDVRAGIVSLWTSGFITDPAELDALAHGVIRVAAGVRDPCLGAARPQAWEAALPAPPTWGAAAHRHDDMRAAIDQAIGRAWARSDNAAAHIFDPGAAGDDEIYAGVRDVAVTYAQDRGLALEDGRSFDRAFPSLPFPGWALCSWRGERPRGVVRLVMTAQRPPAPTGTRAVGALASVGPAAAGTPDREVGWDADAERWTAVSGGFDVAWVTHATLDVTHARLDDLLR